MSICAVDYTEDAEKAYKDVLGWLRGNVNSIGKIECDKKWLEFEMGMDPSMAYERIEIPRELLDLLLQVGCEVSITCSLRSGASRPDGVRETLK